MTADPIIDPSTGNMTTVYALSRETGVAAHIIWHRYTSLGVRSMALIAPKGTPIDIDAEHAAAYEIWRRSTAGILSTHRLGEYALARKQHREAA